MAIVRFFVKLYQLLWLYIAIAQWLRYQACEPQTMSSNLTGAFVHVFRIIFFYIFEIRIFHSKLQILWPL